MAPSNKNHTSIHPSGIDSLDNISFQTCALAQTSPLSGCSKWDNSGKKICNIGLAISFVTAESLACLV